MFANGRAGAINTVGHPGMAAGRPRCLQTGKQRRSTQLGSQERQLAVLDVCKRESRGDQYSWARRKASWPSWMFANGKAGAINTVGLAGTPAGNPRCLQTGEPGQPV